MIVYLKEYYPKMAVGKGKTKIMGTTAIGLMPKAIKIG